MSGVATKTCPHCGAGIPSFAVKCKHCFGDLVHRPEPAKRAPWGWMLLTLVMAGICAATLASVFNTKALAQVTVDEGSQSIFMVWTSYRGDPTTRRIAFSDIAKIEYITDANMFSGKVWEVYVVTAQGERILINTSEQEDLQSYAEGVVMRTKKPLIPINRVDIGSTVLGQNGSQP